MSSGASPMLEPQDWSFPIPIAYGPGRISEIASIVRQHAITHPLIVTDGGSANLPFIGELQGFLTQAGLSCDVFSDISPNPRDDEIATGGEVFRAGKHDGIIAIGGGSGMDAGKAICLTAMSGTPLWDFEFERPAPDLDETAFPPLITIPTTAGTGAETESTAMVTDTAKGMKFCVWHTACKPACAILDPELTLGLPPHLTAWTGVDAMVHAIEAYCVPGFHPLCDGLALEGLRLIARWLPVAYREPSNLEARGAMLTGSCLAGIAFLKGLGLVHAISHMVGAEYDTQHGLTNAILLPSVLRFNAPDIGKQIGPMAEAMGLRDASFDGFYSGVCEVLDGVAIPRTLAEIGVPSDGIARIAEKALQDSAAGTNPRSLSTLQIKTVLQEALTVGR